jgi:autotransporter-associated beta strand protein
LGTLDLNNSGMIVKNGEYEDMIENVRHAYDPDTGMWNRTGISSLVAQYDPNYLTMLGILTGQEFTGSSPQSPLFLGENVTSPNWILVRPTVLGDSNLDGLLDTADFNLITTAWQVNHDTDPNNDVPETWLNGDYDYDEALTSIDYTTFIYSWNIGGGQFSHALTLYWDADGDQTTNTGGAGSWYNSDTISRWRVGSSTGPLVKWMPGSNAVFSGTSGNITISNTVTANSLNFASDGFVLSGGSINILSTGLIVAIDTGAGEIRSSLVGDGGLAKTGNGVLTLSGTNSYAGNTTVNGGELRFTKGTGNTPLIDIEAGKAVFAEIDNFKPDLDIVTGDNAIFEVANHSHKVHSITGTGMTTVDSLLAANYISQNTLTIKPNAKVELSPSASFELRMIVDELDIQGTSETLGTLDINNAGMIVKNDTYSQIAGLIRKGANFDTGFWDGRGITSLAAREDVNGFTGIGIASIADGFDSFMGMTLPSTENWILVRYTLVGDTDLNGHVEPCDYFALLAGYDMETPTTWIYGDFDYNGVTDDLDYNMILSTFGTSL